MSSTFPSTQYYYNVDSATHQSKTTALAGQGFRMIDVCVSGTPPTERYAAIFVKGGNAPASWQARHGLNSTSYGQISTQLASQGLTPVCVSVTGMASNATFAGIWETKTASTNEVAPNVPDAQLVTTYNNYWNRGMRLLAFKEYGTSSDRRYAMLFCSRPDLQKLTWWFHETSVQHQTNFNTEITKPFYRPLSVTGSEDGYLCSTYCDYDNGSWEAHHGMSQADLTQKLQLAQQQGRHPISLQSYGSSNAPLYAVICTSIYPTSARQWSVATGASNLSAAAQIETLVQNFMRRHNIRNGQFSVGRQGTLLLEHAYSWCEPSHTHTSVSDVFLLASVSKAFCEAAVQVLFDRHTITPSTPAYRSVGFTSFADPRLAYVTVQQLLDHYGGLDIDASGFDPVFAGRQISQEMSGGSRPATIADTVGYMAKRRLDFDPGARYAYSNYGYVLLSLIVERLGGESTYFNFLQKNVLQPNHLDVRFWPTAESSHSGDRIKQESWKVGLSALLPNADTQVANVYGGDGLVKEACVGPSSLAASASTLVRFISNHAVWGNGGRSPNSTRFGAMDGSRTGISSQNNGLDISLVFNTRDFWDDNEFGTLFDAITSIVDRQ